MAIVDDHMRAYERELVLDEAVRRATGRWEREAIDCVGKIMRPTLNDIRAEFRRIMAAA